MSVYEIIYCDNDIVVVNKAPNVACHPLGDSKIVTLIEAMSQAFPEVIASFPGDREGGLCHRIDNGTSGLVVVARHPAAREQFRALFHGGKIEKSYLALVKGRMSGTFEASSPIAHHPKNARKMVALTSPQIRHRSHPQAAHTHGK